MEGGDLAPDGTVLGDEAFHRIGMGTDADAERDDAEFIALHLDALREEQAERFAKLSRNLGRESYEGLLALHPNSPRVEYWRRRAEELK
jgi:hypothetical protein